jgi:thioredoxin domain-containing protein 5
MLLREEEEKAEKEAGVVILTRETFSDVIGANGYTFVAFTLPWCIHCKKLAPVWRELSSSFSNEPLIKIAKVDCQQENQLCRPNGVEIYPTLILYRAGKKLDEYSGKRELEPLKEFVVSNQVHRDEL